MKRIDDWLYWLQYDWRKRAEAAETPGGLDEMDNRVLVNDEFWIIKRFGPHYYTATSKHSGEHRIYWSFDALERDFGGKVSQAPREGKGGPNDISLD